MKDKKEGKKMPRVTLSDGKEVKVDIFYDEKEIEAVSKGLPIIVKKRTTQLKITDEKDSSLNMDATVSCSHKDKFTKFEGRKEAFKILLKLNGNKLSRTNRKLIAKAIGIV